jgi:hypothetical protein
MGEEIGYDARRSTKGEWSMRRSLLQTGARLAGWRAVALATAAVLLASWSIGQTAPPEKKAAEGQKPSAAGQEKLPKADELIARMVEALGGEQAMKKITNRVSKGTFEQGPLKGSVTVYEAAPDKSLQITELPSGQTIEEGTNGEIYWRLSPMGPQIIGGEEAAVAKRHSDFYLWLNWRKHYTGAETVGTARIDDHSAYKVVMKTKEAPPETWYIDEKTHLLDRVDLTVPQAGTVETYLEDYRKQDGVMIPFKTRMMGGPAPLIVTLTSVEQNTEIPKDRFEPPPAIRELAKEAVKGPGQPGQPPPPAKPEQPGQPEKPEKPVKP